jgi:hypothetical protein
MGFSGRAWMDDEAFDAEFLAALLKADHPPSKTSLRLLRDLDKD